MRRWEGRCMIAVSGLVPGDACWCACIRCASFVLRCQTHTVGSYRVQDILILCDVSMFTAVADFSHGL